MENKSAFEIVITDEQWLDGERIVHKPGYDTMNICRLLHPTFDVLDYVDIRKTTDYDPVGIQHPEKYYTDIALRLCGVSKEKLRENFSNISIHYQLPGVDKKYEFDFAK